MEDLFQRILRLLVPERGKGGWDSRLVKPLGINAIPLRFLDMLLKDSIRPMLGRLMQEPQ